MGEIREGRGAGVSGVEGEDKDKDGGKAYWALRPALILLQLSECTRACVWGAVSASVHASWILPAQWCARAVVVPAAPRCPTLPHAAQCCPMLPHAGSQRVCQCPAARDRVRVWLCGGGVGRGCVHLSAVHTLLTHLHAQFCTHLDFYHPFPIHAPPPPPHPTPPPRRPFTHAHTGPRSRTPSMRS